MTRAGGFTIIELLVSAALIGIIMMVMLAATSTSMSIWRNSERAIAVDREGRNAFALMADDFANMLPVSKDAPDYLQPLIAVWKDYVFAEFFVLRPRDYQAVDGGNDGDVCYVRYRYRDQKIERAIVDSADTFAALKEENRPPSAESDFEIVAEGLPGFQIFTFNGLGEDVSPEKDSEEIKNVRFAGVSMEAKEKEELDNAAVLKSGGTSAEMLSSLKYFSNFFEVPRPD